MPGIGFEERDEALHRARPEDVVISGNGEDGGGEPVKKGARLPPGPGELGPLNQITAADHKVRFDLVREGVHRLSDPGLEGAAEMKIRDV
jgi:hypothetical protein